MKINKTLILFILLLTGYRLNAQIDFNSFFTDGALRIDMGLKINADTLEVIQTSFKKEPVWGGNPTLTIDNINAGSFSLRVYDSISTQLIFSKNYSSLAQEYSQTSMAGNESRYFEESVQMPFPKSTVIIEFLQRNDILAFSPVDTFILNPYQDMINKEEIINYRIEDIQVQGESPYMLDFVFLPEGYTQDEMKKFLDDANRFKDTLLSWEPYTYYKEYINVRAVMAPSMNSGIDIPFRDEWSNSLLNASFGTFGSDRYITSKSIYKIRDVAACVPYDQICILVNSDKYGGGGIYNNYCIFTTGHQHSGFLFLHELGHSFAGLADEYFSTDEETVYTDTLVEPYEINITTLKDFESKWKGIVHDTIPVPTPDTDEYANVTGVFEGAAYASKKVYRSARSCSMKEVVSNKFCVVCREGIRRAIFSYCSRQKEMPAE